MNQVPVSLNLGQYYQWVMKQQGRDTIIWELYDLSEEFFNEEEAQTMVKFGVCMYWICDCSYKEDRERHGWKEY